MSWTTDEASIESSQPREMFEIRTPSTSWRIATGSRNQTIDGRTFTASPAARGEVGVFAIEDTKQLEISLPVSHAFCQRYFSSFAPPNSIAVTVYRKQVTSGEVRTIFRGKITNGSVDRHIATFAVTSTLEELLARRLPTITAGRLCSHTLYDGRCAVVRSAFRVNTTVATLSGHTVTLASSGGQPDQWAQYGELVVVTGAAAGERMTVTGQVGAVVTLQLPIDELRDGDSVQLQAGCDHSIVTCGSKFGARQNFGGLPRLPRGNPFLPDGFGIYQSE